MTTWKLHISNIPECPCADLIRNSQKPVEGRTYTHNRRQMQVGDFVDFVQSGEETVVCCITFIHTYPTLEDYLHGEGVDCALPGVSFERAVELYNTGGVDPPRPWSTPDERELCRQETGFGFVGIGLEPLPVLVDI